MGAHSAESMIDGGSGEWIQWKWWKRQHRRIEGENDDRERYISPSNT